jgi:hypothetical protein
MVPVEDDEQGRGARWQEQHTSVRKAIRMQKSTTQFTIADFVFFGLQITI